MTNHPNRKSIHTLNTYQDITCGWIEASLRADDSLRVKWRSAWQGSTDGRTMLYARTGLLEAIQVDDEMEADAAIEAYIDSVSLIEGKGKLLSRGAIVR